MWTRDILASKLIFETTSSISNKIIYIKLYEFYIYVITIALASSVTMQEILNFEFSLLLITTMVLGLYF